jgi:hypothetical protein
MNRPRSSTYYASSPHCHQTSDQLSAVGSFVRDMSLLNLTEQQRNSYRGSYGCSGYLPCDEINTAPKESHCSSSLDDLINSISSYSTKTSLALPPRALLPTLSDDGDRLSNLNKEIKPFASDHGEDLLCRPKHSIEFGLHSPTALDAQVCKDLSIAHPERL